MGKSIGELLAKPVVMACFLFIYSEEGTINRPKFSNLVFAFSLALTFVGLHTDVRAQGIIISLSGAVQQANAIPSPGSESETGKGGAKQ